MGTDTEAASSQQPWGKLSAAHPTRRLPRSAASPPSRSGGSSGSAGAGGEALLGTLVLQWVPADGWADSTRTIILVALGCYVVSFATVFLLPLRAREEGLH